MPWRVRLLAITFIESVSTILLERGIYFYTHDRLEFSESANLWLALSFGVAYVAGALVSHPLALRFGERRVLLTSIAALLAVHALIALSSDALTIAVAFPVTAALHGIKWPVVESYVGAGLTPRQTLAVIGRFNVSWAAAVPIGVGVSGPIVASASPWMLFALAGGLNVIGFAIALRLAARPTHTPHDHPERPDATRLIRYRALLTSSRWSMLASYCLLFLLAPLLPGIFVDRLGQPVELASESAAVLDVVRVGMFALLSVWTIWYGRAWPLIAALIALPAGFFMVLFGVDLATVLVGEVLFGAASGLTYYAALYYALVVKNASVDAGGAHEGLIGAGFAIGPMMGLVGLALTDWAGGYVAGMLLGVGPVLLLCTLAAARPLWKLRLVAGR